MRVCVCVSVSVNPKKDRHGTQCPPCEVGQSGARHSLTGPPRGHPMGHPMGHPISHGSSHIPWVIPYPMGHPISHGSSHGSGRFNPCGSSGTHHCGAFTTAKGLGPPWVDAWVRGSPGLDPCGWEGTGL